MVLGYNFLPIVNSYTIFALQCNKNKKYSELQECRKYRNITVLEIKVHLLNFVIIV